MSVIHGAVVIYWTLFGKANILCHKSMNRGQALNASWPLNAGVWPHCSNTSRALNISQARSSSPTWLIPEDTLEGQRLHVWDKRHMKMGNWTLLISDSNWGLMSLMFVYSVVIKIHGYILPPVRCTVDVLIQTRSWTESGPWSQAGVWPNCTKTVLIKDSGFCSRIR